MRTHTGRLVRTHRDKPISLWQFSVPVEASQLTAKTPGEKVEGLYKMLLAPTTFIILTAWTFISQSIQFLLTHPEFPRYPGFELSEDSLALALALLVYELASFTVSVFVFVALAWNREGRLARSGKIVSLWLLVLTLAIAGYSFVLAVWPLSLLPIAPDIELIGVTLISLAISYLAVRRAYSAR